MLLPHVAKIPAAGAAFCATHPASPILSPMNWFNTIAIVVVVYLAVFLQATSNELRHWLGVQIDLLPSLVVYASLSRGIATMSCVAVCGGLWLDSLSANPLGISVLPLFLVGLLIQRSRDLIL